MSANTNRPKTVFILDPYTQENIYGGQSNILVFTRFADRSRFRIIVASPGPSGFFENGARFGEKAVIIPLGSAANTFGKKIKSFSLAKKLLVGLQILAFNWRAWRFFGREGVDLVYVNNERALLYVLLAAKARGLPLVWFVRGADVARALAWIGCRAADGIGLIAESMRQVFCPEDQRRFAHKTEVIYTGWPLEEHIFAPVRHPVLARELGLPEEVFLIGVVAILHPRKGHDLLIEAAPAILRAIPQAVFVFIGGEAEDQENWSQQLKSRIKGLGLTDKFFWLGFRTDITELYASLNLLVLPSRSEGLPGVTVEGLLAGLPVVTTDVGGAAEVIRHKSLGRVVPPESPAALAEAVIDLYQAKDLAPEMRLARRQFCEKYFSLDCYISQFSEFLARVLAGHDVRRRKWFPIKPGKHKEV